MITSCTSVLPVMVDSQTLEGLGLAFRLSVFNRETGPVEQAHATSNPVNTGLAHEAIATGVQPIKSRVTDHLLLTKSL